MPSRGSIKQYVRARHDSIVSRLSGVTLKEETIVSLKSYAEHVPRLTKLPNEILIHIARYLRPDIPEMEKEERFDGKERYTFVEGATDLRNLSETCRALRMIAQEALLHTVVLGGFDGLPAIVSLVRYLLDHPEAGRHVKRLRIGLPPNERYYFASDTDADNLIWSSKLQGPPPSDIWLRAAEVIAYSPFTPAMKQGWLNELAASYARPLCGVLLALVPKLEYLSISHSLGIAADNRILKKMFGVQTTSESADFSALASLAHVRYFNDKTPLSIAPRLR
jgi:hypothetical protein